MYFDDLPDESQNDVLSLFQNEFGPHIHHHAPDGSGRLNRQVQVLDLEVGVHGLHVDSGG